MKTLTFQLYSDMHLEFSKKYPHIKPLAKYLFLAGDIGKINTVNFEPFFDYCSQHWEKVFYCLGNHEFYHSKKSFTSLKADYRTLFEKYNNVFLIDDSCVEFDNIVVLGNPLWSNPSSANGLNDFNHIRMVTEDITRKYDIRIEQFQQLHKDCGDYILTQLEKHKNKNIIVMTHFPPTQENTSSPKYKNQVQYLKDYFASNFVKNIPDVNDIVCWIYGHTHFSNNMDSGKNFKYFSNQMGYLDEINETNFNEDGLFTVTLKY